MLPMKFLARAMFCSLELASKHFKRVKPDTWFCLTPVSLCLCDDAPDICTALSAALVDHRVDELTGVRPEVGGAPTGTLSVPVPVWLRTLLLCFFDQTRAPSAS